MAKKITKKINSQFYPTLFNYGLGGFLGRNAGNFAQIAGGALLTATGLGAPAGIAMMASGAGGIGTTEVNNSQQKKNAVEQELLNREQQAIANLPGQPQYIPTFARGGKFYHNKLNSNEILDRVSNMDTGSTHEQSPIGGIPIGQNALVEKGEFLYTTKSGKKYVFSNRF